MELVFLVDLDETMVHTEYRWEPSPTRYNQWAAIYFLSDGAATVPVYVTQEEFHKMQVESVRKDRSVYPPVTIHRFKEYPGRDAYVAKYRTEVNPFTPQVLSYLRSFGYPVKIFTAAAWGYASAHNRLFNLGFEEREIFAKDHSPEPLLADPSKFFLIIDNMPEYLNKKVDRMPTNRYRYHQFVHFDGRSDYSSFPVMERLKEFVEKSLGEFQKGA